MANKGTLLAALGSAWQGNRFLSILRHQTPLGSVSRYGLAVVSIAAAMMLRQALTAWVGPGLPTYITFYPAIMTVALLAGFGPGLAATALTGPVVAYWVLAPFGWTVKSPVDRLGLVIFACMGLFMSVVAELYRRSRDKAAEYDREQALVETRREKEFLANLLEHAEQPFAVGYPDGRIGRFNRAYEQLTGYTAAELRGRDWSTALTPPEWREVEKKKLEELERIDQPVRYEKEYIRKDGSRVPIELLVHVVRNAKGEPDYYYSFISDITERRRAEQVVRESEERLRQVLQASSMGTFEVDLRAGTTRWNATEFELLGLKPGEVPPAPETFFRFVHPDDIGLLQTRWEEALRVGKLDAEFRVIRSNGDVRWLAGRGQFVFEDQTELRETPTVHGQALRFLGVNFDITGRKQAEEALRESEARFHAIAAQTPDHILMQDRELRYQMVINPQLGLRVADMLGKTDRDFLGPEEAERLTAIKRKVLETGEPASLVTSLRNSKGEAEFFEGVYVSKLGPNGKADGLIGYFRNITERQRVEEALRANEATLRGILDATLESVWLFGANGTVLTGNAVAFSRLGKPPAEIIGKHFSEILPSELAQSRLARLKEAAESGNPIEFEDERSGILFHHSYYPVRDAQGHVSSIACFSRDITALKRADVVRQRLEAALRRNQERQEILASTASRLLTSKEPQEIVNELCEKVMAYLDCHAFFNFLVDEKSQRLHLNAWTGIPAEKAKEIEWLDFGVAVCGCAAQQGCRIVAEDIQNRPDPRTELVRSFGLKAYACHPLQSQGRVIGTLSFGTRSRPSFSEDDLALMKGVTDLVATAMERVRAEEALRNQKEELETIYKTVPIGLAIADDSQGLHIRGNPAHERLLGVSPGGELSMAGPHPARFRALQNGRELPVEKLPMQRAIRGETVMGQILEVLREDGQTAHLHCSAAPLFKEHGQPRGAVGAFLDITELKQVEAARQRLEEALRQANAVLEHQVRERTHELQTANIKLTEEIQERKRAEAERLRVESIAHGRERLAMLGELAAGVAHELRNPLQGVMSYMDLVKLETHGEQTLAPLLKHMEEGLQEMDRMAAQLLDLSRQDQDPAIAIPLGPIIERAWGFLQVRATKQGVTLNHAIEHDLPLVTGNPARLTEVFLNLFKNSLDALGEPGAGVPGTISVTAHVHPRTAGMVEVLITDNGPGIPVGIRDKVFQPFFTTKPSGKGTGLGLAMVRKMAEGYGGYVDVAATSLPGTTIGLGLPIAEEKDTKICPTGFIIA